MSISSKKRDKDKDGKTASGGEASTNYTIGTASRGGRTSDTREEEEEVVAATTTSTAPDRATSNQERIIPQKERITTMSQVPRDETPGAIVETPTTSTRTVTEVPNMYEQKEQQESGINRALDETRDNIRRSIDEAKSQIPHYTQATNEYQEQTVQASREIADNFLESQKDIINSLQSAWLSQIDAVNRVFTSSWISPRYFAHIYTNMISNFADNIVATTRLLNNMVFTNMKASRTTIQQARDNVKEFSRIAVNAARSLEQPTRDTTAAASAQISSTYFPSTSSGFYSDRGGYALNEEQEQQIPSRQNEEDTQRVLEAQNHIGGQRREQTVTDLPRAAAVGQALKDLRFPADKNRILQFVKERSNSNPDCKKMAPLLDKIENRQYQNVSDITKAVGIVG
jgi:hypothetical protein